VALVSAWRATPPAAAVAAATAQLDPAAAAVARPAAATPFGHLQVSITGDLLLVFDTETGSVGTITLGDKGAPQTLGTLRKNATGRWELGPAGAANVAPPPAADAARTTAARADVLVLMTALNRYKADVGRYPSTEEGLQALIVQSGGADNWKGPYLKQEVPKDPWGNPYVYRNPGKQNPTGVDVYSFGPDTREAGGDDIFPQ
jgi:type II secretion system protein G